MNKYTVSLLKPQILKQFSQGFVGDAIDEDIDIEITPVVKDHFRIPFQG